MSTSVLTHTLPETPLLELLDFPPELAMPTDDLETRLRDDYDVFWDKFTNRVNFASPELEAYEKTVGLQKERDYFDKFVSSVRTMAKRQPKGIVTLLLDVDDNIGIVKEDEDDKGIQVLVRPAFLLAMDVLSHELPGRLELGLLTSRPQQTLNDEARHPTFLSGVDPKLMNPNYFISSRDPERDNKWLQRLADTHATNWASPSQDPLLRQVANVISIDKARSMPDSAQGMPVEGLPVWYDAKLVILDQIMRSRRMEQTSFASTGQYKRGPLLKIIETALKDPTEKERAFVFMDDRPCASVIQDSPYLMGVCMADVQQDVLTRAMVRGSGITAVAA